VFNYETESVENYENRQVTKTRAVYHYEDQDVFNYEDQEVLNFEPVYETRQRKVESRKDPELLCSDGHIIDHSDNKCKKNVETVKSTINSCDGISKVSLRSVLGTSQKVTYTSNSWRLGGSKCHRSVTTPPVGCDTKYKLLRLKDGSFCRHPKASPFGTVDIFGTDGIFGTVDIKAKKPIEAKEPILGFAPDSLLTYHADEDDDAERKLWEPYFISGGEQVYNGLTDLSIRKAKKGESPDVKWRVHDIPNIINGKEYYIAGYFECSGLISNNLICPSGEIVINDEAFVVVGDKCHVDKKPRDLCRKNLICHELGHSVGFHHGTAKSSCINGGYSNELDNWEVTAINLQY